MATGILLPEWDGRLADLAAHFHDVEWAHIFQSFQVLSRKAKHSESKCFTSLMNDSQKKSIAKIKNVASGFDLPAKLN